MILFWAFDVVLFIALGIAAYAISARLAIQERNERIRESFYSESQ